MSSYRMNFNMSIQDYYDKLQAQGRFKGAGNFNDAYVRNSFFKRFKIVKVWDLLAISEENVRSHYGFSDNAMATVIALIKDLKESHAKQVAEEEGPPTLEDVQIKLEHAQAELARSKAFCRELEEAAALAKKQLTELQKEKEKNNKRIRELESQDEKSGGFVDIQRCKTTWRKLYKDLAKILHPDKNIGVTGQGNRTEGFKAAASLNDYFNGV